MKSFFSLLSNSVYEYYQGFIHVLPRLLFAIVILVFAFFVARRIKGYSRNHFQKRAKDPLLSQFLSEIIRLTVIIIGIAVVLGVAGLSGAASKILAGAGITAFILGFAFKDIGENFLAGIILAFKRPFHVGDVVESNGVKGKVTGMTLRETTLKTFDGKDVFMPNSMILNTPLINYTADIFNRIEFTVAVPVSSEVQRAVEIILRILNEKKELLLEEKMPLVQLDSIAGANINLIVRFWIKTVDEEREGIVIKSEVMQKTLTALREAGFIK